ncbi:MAG TPA: glucose-6-phosphate isomerase, partial [Burkholderiales bacterium]|nr:glucose-6-phosphate isomerase [Burkholderiales bacterium]
MTGSPTRLRAWQALRDHHRVATGLSLRELFEQDPQRFDRLSLQCADILFDYSKHRVTDETLHLLIGLAREREL